LIGVDFRTSTNITSGSTGPQGTQYTAITSSLTNTVISSPYIYQFTPQGLTGPGTYVVNLPFTYSNRSFLSFVNVASNGVTGPIGPTGPIGATGPSYCPFISSVNSANQITCYVYSAVTHQLTIIMNQSLF
jgi:hypothetical protein